MKIHLSALALLLSGAGLNASQKAIDALLAVGPEGAGNTAASAAWSELVEEVDPDGLIRLLEAMDGASPIASNWLRSAAEVISDKLLAKDHLDTTALGEFMLDRGHAPRARRLAFEMIRARDSAAAQALVPGLLNDPSPELRREAVARLVLAAEKFAAKGNESGATLLYRQALGGAVEADQVTPIADALAELGTKVDLPSHYGFLMRWQTIGPFDNTARAGFETAFPPEAKIDLGAEYAGKSGQVKWQPLASSHRFGKIDLNKPYGMLKDTTAYAYSEFESPAARAAELRLGCKNAWKIWLNGELVFGRDEYHRGQRIDQYRLPVQLAAGKNTILVKACQNEQTEEWTVQWEFQLRVCDATGSAILSTTRLPTPEPAQPTRKPRRPKKP